MKRIFLFLVCTMSFICTYGQNQVLERLLLDKSTNFFDLDVKTDEHLIIENHTDCHDVFQIAILGEADEWFYIGTTPELWSREEACPGGRMTDNYNKYKYSSYSRIEHMFPAFRMPMRQIAILAKSSKKFSIKIIVNTYDLVVQIHPIGTKFSISAAQGLALPTHKISTPQNNSNAIDVDGVKSKLQLLKDLYDSNIITEEEFEQRKILILNSISENTIIKESTIEAEAPETIRRSGNSYYLRDRCMNKLQYQQFLHKNCQPAYEKFTAGLVTSYVGWGLLAIGVTLDFSSMIVSLNNRKNITQPSAPSTLGWCATGIELASIGLLAGGYATMHNSVYTYNQTCASSSPTYFSFNANPGSLSVAYNF